MTRKGCGCCSPTCEYFLYTSDDCPTMRSDWTLNGAAPAGSWDCTLAPGDVIATNATYLTSSQADNVFWFSAMLAATSGALAFPMSGPIPEFTIELTNDADTLGFIFQQFISDAPGSGTQILDSRTNVSVNGGSFSSTVRLKRTIGATWTTKNPGGSQWASTTETYTSYVYYWYEDGDTIPLTLSFDAVNQQWSASDTNGNWALPNLTPRFREDAVNDSYTATTSEASDALSVPYPHRGAIFLPKGLWASLRARLTNDSTGLSFKLKYWYARRMQNDDHIVGMDCTGAEGTPPPASATALNTSCEAITHLCQSSRAELLDSANSLTAWVSSVPSGVSELEFASAKYGIRTLCSGNATSWNDDREQLATSVGTLFDSSTLSEPVTGNPTSTVEEDGPNVVLFNCNVGNYQFEYYYYERNEWWTWSLPVSYLDWISAGNDAATYPSSLRYYTGSDFSQTLNWMISWFGDRVEGTNTVNVRAFVRFWYWDRFGSGIGDGGLDWSTDLWPQRWSRTNYYGPSGQSTTSCPGSFQQSSQSPVYELYRGKPKSTPWIEAASPQTIDLCNDTFPLTLSFSIPSGQTINLPDWLLFYPEYSQFGVPRCRRFEWEYRQSQCPYDGIADFGGDTYTSDDGFISVVERSDWSQQRSISLDGLGWQLTVADPYGVASKIPS